MPNKEQLQAIFQRVGYVPTSEQEQVHYTDARLRLVAGGERSGKSALSGMDGLARLFYGKLFWLVAADYARTRAEFDYIVEGLQKLGLKFTASKNVDPGEIILEGGIRIETKSAKDPRKLAMEAPDGIIVCEASQIDYETYQRLRGRLAEKRGWMLLSGTFESSLGWYVEAYERGQGINPEGLVSFSLPTWTNLHIFPGGRNDPEIIALENTFSREWFLERFGGIPTPPKGLVFNEFRQHIHAGYGGQYEFDPALDCYLFVDPGYATVYSVLVAQKRGENLSLVDEVYERGLVTSDIIKICQQKPWWNKVVGGAIDIAGTQHQGMPAPSEVWLKEGKIFLRSRKLKIRDGIEATKRLLIVSPLTGQALLHINIKCQGLISEWGGSSCPLDGQTKVYRWRMDSANNVLGEVPEDKNNHSSKALAYGVVDLFGFSAAQAKKTKVTFH